MILPVTNVELPSDEWSLVRFKHRVNNGVGAMRFSAFLHHAPTSKYAMVFSDGSDDPIDFMWDVTSGEAKAIWYEFVAACRDIASNEDEVIRLMAKEQIRQKNFNGIVGTVVRTDAGDVIYGEFVDELRGRVQGSYWSVKEKNWIPLD